MDVFSKMTKVKTGTGEGEGYKPRAGGGRAKKAPGSRGCRFMGDFHGVIGEPFLWDDLWIPELGKGVVVPSKPRILISFSGTVGKLSF